MAWKEQIPACFDGKEFMFAPSPEQRSKARHALAAAGDEGASWQDFENELRGFMTKRDCTTAHIAEQIVKARDVGTYLP